MLSKSGYEWTGEQTRGRAEGEGINVEALTITATGNLLIGFRGPLTQEGGALALEIELPESPEGEPTLVDRHLLPVVNHPGIEEGAARTLRAMTPVPGAPGDYYVLLGPLGYEKEEVVLSRWHTDTGKLTRPTQLPSGFVGEGVTAIPGSEVLVVDDLDAMVLIASEH